MDSVPQKKRKLEEELAFQEHNGQLVGPQLPLAGGATHAERMEILEQKLRHLRSWMAQLQRTLEGSNQIAVQNSRRLFVGGIPSDVTQEELVSFLEDAIAQSGAGIAPGKAIHFCRIQLEKNFAFIELRSAEEATNVMALDGICMRGSTPLKIKRPSKYDAATALMLGPSTPDPTIDLRGLIMSSLDSAPAPHQGKYEHNWNTLYVGGLPTEWGQQQVTDLLQQYGTVKYIRLTLDKETKVSKGYAFAEFADDASTSEALSKLNGLHIGSRSITVNRLLEHKAQQHHQQQQQQNQQQQQQQPWGMGGPMGGNMGQAGAMGMNMMQRGVGVGQAAGTAGAPMPLNLAAGMNQGSIMGGQMGGQLGQMGGMMGASNLGMAPSGNLGIGMGMTGGGMMQPQQPGMMGLGMMSTGNMAQPGAFTGQQTGGMANQIGQIGFKQQQMGQLGQAGYSQQQFAPQMGSQQGLYSQQQGIYNHAPGIGMGPQQQTAAGGYQQPGMGMTGNAVQNDYVANAQMSSYLQQAQLQQQTPAMPVPPPLSSFPDASGSKSTLPAADASAAAGSAMLGSQQLPTASQGVGATGTMGTGAWGQAPAGVQQQRQQPQHPTFPSQYASYNGQM